MLSVGAIEETVVASVADDEEAIVVVETSVGVVSAGLADLVHATKKSVEMPTAAMRLFIYEEFYLNYSAGFTRISPS